jgi:CRISPR-associated protein (TIGR02584 family)
MSNDCLTPEHHSRRILLVATGLSPQVVTETLFHLCQQRQPPFVPSEIHLITTGEGAHRAELTLLHPSQGRFARFLGDFALVGKVAFHRDHIHVLRDADGEVMPDIRSDTDNTAAADAISERVRQFTADPGCALHVSLAGGRKTLGYYLGYALTLFGRPQDRLSHVLVSSPFENNHQFYYPPPVPEVLFTSENQPINTADARITLAEIPFVSLRHGLPQHLLDGQASYMETVNAARKSFAAPQLVVDYARRELRCGGETVVLPPQLFAWYAWLARRRKGVGGKGGHLRWTDAGVIEDFLAEYRRVVGGMAHDLEEAARALHSGGEAPKVFFEQKKSRVQRLLRSQLGFAARPYLVLTSGKRGEQRFGLGLAADQIELREPGIPS